MKRSMKYLPITALLLVITLGFNSTVVLAEVDLRELDKMEDEKISDGNEYLELYEAKVRNTYIKSCSAGLTLSGSTATSTGYCYKYSNLTDKDITIYVYLQKKSGSDWNTVNNTRQVFSGKTYGNVSMTTTGLSKGTYRTKVSCWVGTENVDVVSNSRTY